MIEMKKVSFRYRGSSHYALKNINLNIKRYEITAIVGRNGAGKSTLLRLLNGLIPHFYEGELKGRVLIDGMDTREHSVAELSRKVGLVFQNPEHMLFADSVWEEVSFGPKNLKLPNWEELCEKALKETGLVDLKEVSPWSLSGGEMKRLSIACVLAMNTDYIALDEPTVGQDLASRRRISEILKSLRKEGKGIIVVSHDLEWILQLNPDRVIVIKKGNIAADGGPNILGDLNLLAESGLVPPASSIIARALGIEFKYREEELADEIRRCLA